MPKIRLVKVLAQPMFVLDHGTHIEEIEHPTVTISADHWPEYSGKTFPREVEEWQAQLDTEGAPEKPKPNRTARRAKKH